MSSLFAAFLSLCVRQANLAKDVKNELETTLGILSGKGKGVKGKGPRGAERKKLWDEVKALRKEYGLVVFFAPNTRKHIYIYFRYRRREGGVVKSVLAESQVCDFALFVFKTVQIELHKRS